jgi:hypothetical protein
MSQYCHESANTRSENVSVMRTGKRNTHFSTVKIVLNMVETWKQAVLKMFACSAADCGMRYVGGRETVMLACSGE